MDFGGNIHAPPFHHLEALGSHHQRYVEIVQQTKIAGHRKLAGVVHVGGKFAPDAVDALYIGCRGTIDQLVSDLLHVEAGDGMATAGGERVPVRDVPPRKPASQPAERKRLLAQGVVADVEA